MQSTSLLQPEAWSLGRRDRERLGILGFVVSPLRTCETVLGKRTGRMVKEQRLPKGRHFKGDSCSSCSPFSPFHSGRLGSFQAGLCSSCSSPANGAFSEHSHSPSCISQSYKEGGDSMLMRSDFLEVKQLPVASIPPALQSLPVSLPPEVGQVQIINVDFCLWVCSPNCKIMCN